MEYKNWKDNQAIYAFVINDCWATPGMSAVADKKLGNNKMSKIKSIGQLGPIFDLIVRGSMVRLLILNFGSDVKSFTSPNEGILMTFLKRIEDEEIKRIIPLWFRSPCVTNFEASLRNLRSSIIKSWINTLRSNPYNQVILFTFCNNFRNF